MPQPTCHWCHVMAHETFENFDAADILNKHFISIKVDREERPDIDGIYMEACQRITGSGGWPLTIFLDFEKRPFFAGTYFPLNTFKTLLNQIRNLWDTKPELLKSQAEMIVDSFKKEKTVTGYISLENAPSDAFNYLDQNFDPKFGGFTFAPKFPSPHNLLFLLKHYDLTGEKNSLKMCEKTLEKMQAGGIYDHIGGGFSRYSTDEFWLVPHFEKMLYDNSLLIMAYSRCYEITKDEQYARTAEKTIEYLMRDMMNPGGAFFTAEDADSEGHEGLFYTFTFDEIQQILLFDAAEFNKYFNVTEKGNFEGRNILNTINKKIPQERGDFVQSCLKKLFDFRATRIRPHKDKKIMTSYNGLMTAALCLCGKIMHNGYYIDAAKKTADFIEKNLIDKNGRLLSIYPGKSYGFGEDYAFYIWGLLELYKTVQNNDYLNLAIKLQEQTEQYFFDNENGGFYISAKDSEQMIMRNKELYDGAVPSYNSVAMHNLLKLYKFTGENKYLYQLTKTLKFFSHDIAHQPNAYIHSVSLILSLQRDLSNINVCTDTVCRPPAKNIEELISYF